MNYGYEIGINRYEYWYWLNKHLKPMKWNNERIIGIKAWGVKIKMSKWT